MGNCNTRALFGISVLTCSAAEVCFWSVLLLVPSEIKTKEASKNESKFCWSNFQSSDPSSEAKCPYFALFLAAIVNGILLLFTASFLLARLLGTKECSLKRIPVCRQILRYGTFIAGMVTAVLVLTFIAIVIRFNSKEEWSGGIINRKNRHVMYFIITCVGFVLVLVSSVTSGLIAFRRSVTTQNDDFAESIYRSYSSQSTEDFFDIN